MDLELVLPGHGDSIADHVALIDERFRMHERRAEKIPESPTPIAHKRRMALNDDSLKACNLSRDGSVVSRRYGVRIEKASAIVEFDLSRSGQARESELDLLGNRAGRNAFSKCVAPQIAHQTSPGALAIGEKDGRDGNDLA